IALWSYDIGHGRVPGPGKMAAEPTGGTDMTRVGVIGGGLMGSGIAEVCARAGHDVVVHEISLETAEAALGRIHKSLDRGVERGKITAEEAEAAKQRITVATYISAQADRQIVIEAATENEEVKKALFADLYRDVADPVAILASNTSSIPVTRLAAVTGRPSRVIGLRFFSPVRGIALLELITTASTDPALAGQAQASAEGIGKCGIRAKDRAGLIVNMLLIPYMLAGIRMLEAGFATREDIDAGMRLGANHPMRPLELTDFVGLDTTKYVADVLYEEYKEPLYAAPPLLSRMVEAGWLGRKTGRGFYEYE